MLCDEKESQELARLQGSFWQGDCDFEAKTISAETEEETWELEVVAALNSLKSVAVEDGWVLSPYTMISALTALMLRADADNPYHVSQLNIILDRTDALLEAFADGLAHNNFDRISPEYVSSIHCPTLSYATFLLLVTLT